MFYYDNQEPINGEIIKLGVVRSDLAPIPETVELDIRLDDSNRDLVKESRKLYVGSGRAFYILKSEVKRENKQQGSRLIESVSITGVMEELHPLTFVRDRAIYLENTTFTEIYRACGCKLKSGILNDVKIPLFQSFVGDTPTFAIAKLFQEQGGVLRARATGQLEFLRVPAIFEQEPAASLAANLTEEIQSGFIERHELPYFFSVDQGNSFLLGNSTKPRHVRYVHRTPEDVLRNMTRVLIQKKRARLDLNLSLCAGDCIAVNDGNRYALLTAAHVYSGGIDDAELSQYSRLWLGQMTGSETTGGGAEGS